MALVAVSITKSVPFQGVGEQFSNVYHYDVPTADVATAEQIIDRLRVVEESVHAVIVSFVEGRVWSAGGTPAQNETILVKDLVGAGIEYTDPTMYREAAWVCTFRTGRPSATGKPVHLRKFLHSCSQFASIPVEDVTNGQAPLPVGAGAQLDAYMQNIRELSTPGGIYTLTAPSGRTADRPGEYLPYLQHREYHR